ncbi:MAG: sugar phosphate isomerase/epimerase family protein, partial [Planctomycetota bacterium]
RLFMEERGAWHALIADPDFRDIRFVVEVHENTLCSSVSGALRLLDGLPAERVGVIYDPGNSMQEGNEPLPVCLSLLGDLLVSMHVKDKRLGRDADHWCSLGTESTPLGEGDMNWPPIMRLLRERDYTGPICLENFTGFDRGPERIAADLVWLRQVLQAA